MKLIGHCLVVLILLFVVSPITSALAAQEASPSSSAAAVIYEADWSGGLAGWVGTLDRDTAGSMLINDGSNDQPDAWIVAPIDLSDIPDYAIEAEIQVAKTSGVYGFHLVARIDGSEGYFGGYWQGNDFDQNKSLLVTDCTKEWCSWGTGSNINQQEYVMDNEWHTYRLEVVGASVRLLFDERLVAEISDTQFLDGGHVGLQSVQA